MKLIIKILFLFSVISMIAGYFYFFPSLKLNSQNFKSPNLPFSFKAMDGPHGTQFLGILIGKDYPDNFFYYRSDYSVIIPEAGALGELNYDDKNFIVQAYLPSNKVDSKLQVCNPSEICKTFRIICEGTEGQAPGYSNNKCAITDLPEIKNKIKGAAEIKIAHNDLEKSTLDGVIDDDLKVLGNTGIYTNRKTIIKIKSHDRTFLEQNLDYAYERESFVESEWEATKLKLKAFANSLSKGAKVTEVTSQRVENDEGNRYIYTLSWNANLDLFGLDDYKYELDNLSTVNTIELIAFPSYKMQGENYDQRRDYTQYMVDISLVSD